MKKVAIILDDITQKAGTERAVCNLANILAERNDFSPVIVSLFSSGGSPGYTINDRITIIHSGLTEAKNHIQNIFVYMKISSILKRLNRMENFDIIIGTSVRINVLFAFIKDKKAVKIVCEHFNYDSPSVINKFLRRIVYPKMNAVIVLTSRDAGKYTFCKNVTIIPNSLSFIPKKQSSLENKHILAIGRLGYQKGFDRLVDAFSLIQDECDDWNVRIVGDGEDREKLLKHIIEKGLEQRITIVPPTDKIEDEYCNASMYVMSSRFEGLPMVLIEAKSCGLPIVSFDCPEGPADIIRNGIDGVLVEDGNIKALSDAILRFVENPDIRKRYGQEAVKDIARFSTRHIGKMWFSLFDELIEWKA
jgi:glycosyltransferase involved in cell wall biosynthesis